MFQMNNALQWIVSIALVLYVGYSLVKSGKEYSLYKKNSKAFLETHKDAVECRYGKWQCALLVVMTVACIAMALLAQHFTDDMAQILLYRVAYLCIAIVFAGLTLEMWMHRTIIFSEDGFFIGTQYYRYRMIVTLEKRKGIVKNIKVLFQNGDVIEVSQRIGEEIRVRFNEYKAKKKERKEKRRQH